MEITTPIGQLWLDATDQGLTQVAFFSLATHATNVFTQQAARELAEYFAHERQSFDVPYVFTRGTAFQQHVWRTLATIPYGQSWFYSQLATAIARPSACRAVGQANRNNPLPIILPCHRVIGKNGQLTGYFGERTGRGLIIKQTLLQLEQHPDFSKIRRD